MASGRPLPDAPEGTGKLQKFHTLAATFLLEVLGGCGAVWGCSEAFNVRGGPNNDQWRIVSTVVGVFCLLRWIRLHVLGRSITTECEVLATFLLQVLGGAGAVWGVAEILGLRVNYPSDCHDPRFSGVGNAWAPGYSSCRNTYTAWRVVVLFVVVWFALWWQRAHLGGCRKLSCLPKCIRLASTFVLEVMGGAGALWGVSEVCGPSGKSLRLGWGDAGFGQESFDIWRYACAGVVIPCLARWLVIQCHSPADITTPSLASSPGPAHNENNLSLQPESLKVESHVDVQFV